MAEMITTDDVPCQCDTQGCICTSNAIIRYKSGRSLCACCSADCPDVHPHE